jgi:hypothetical protein
LDVELLREGVLGTFRPGVEEARGKLAGDRAEEIGLRLDEFDDPVIDDLLEPRELGRLRRALGGPADDVDAVRPSAALELRLVRLLQGEDFPELEAAYASSGSTIPSRSSIMRSRSGRARRGAPAAWAR